MDEKVVSQTKWQFITPATRGQISTLLFEGHQKEMCHFSVVSHILHIFIYMQMYIGVHQACF